MAKVIIGVHGLTNKPSKEILEKWWKQSIMEGLTNVYRDDAPDFKFEMVYWADILYEKPLNEKITDSNNLLYIDEPYTKGSKKIKYIANEKRRKFLDLTRKQIGKLLLNKDLSINYSYFTDAIIHRYYKDLEAYYHEKKLDESGNYIFFKDLIRGRLIQKLIAHKNDHVLLLTHSMGSIIAFDVLNLFNTEFNIDTLVTLGSPLGFPVVMGKTAAELKTKFADIRKLSTPDSVKLNWFNFTDIQDRIVFNYRLADDFDKNISGVQVVDYEVYNDYQVNKNKNPHKSFGYLRTSEIAKVIFEFIYGEKLVLKKRFRFRFLKFLIDIKIKTKK